MLNSEIEKILPRLPKSFRRDFDAHVYYTRETRGQAELLRARAARDFAGQPVFVGDLPFDDRLAGPHPLPMFEMNFSRELLSAVQPWLLHHRQGLTILIHEVTGNDPRDHTEGAIWLGEKLALDVTKLDSAPGQTELSSNDK